MTAWPSRVSPNRFPRLAFVPGPIRLLSAGVLINRAGGFVSLFLPLILALRGISAPRIALALGACSVFVIAGAWLGGTLASRVGGKRVIIASMAGSALLTAALVPASTYPVTIAVLCLVALFNRAYVPAASMMVGRFAPPDQRLPMFSFFQLCFNVGVAIGSASAGYLLAHSLTALLLIDAATSACFALVALRLPAADGPVAPGPGPDGPGPADGQAADPGPAPDKLRHDRRYLVFCGATLLVAMAYTQSSGPLPLAFRAHHYNLELLGYLFSANAIAIIVLQLPLSFVTRRWPVRIPLAFGGFLMGGAYLLFAAGFSVPLLIGNVALWTAGETVYAPAAPSAAVMMSRPGAQGRYQGALDVARSAGQALGPPLGVLAFAAGGSLVWWACGVLGAVAACVFWVSMRPVTTEAAGYTAEPAR